MIEFEEIILQFEYNVNLLSSVYSIVKLYESGML